MRRAIVLFVVSSLVVAGCAFDWSFPPDGVTPDDGGGLDGRGGNDGSSDGEVIGKDGSVVDATFPPPVCKDGAGCATGFYCRFSAHDCGKSGSLGECVQTISVCSGPSSTPVCGCDGVVYPTLCAATAAHQDFGGTCAPPPGTFACGASFCNEMKEFCLIKKPDSACTDLKGCPAATCSCPAVTSVGCSGFVCEEKTAGQVTVTCP